MSKWMRNIRHGGDKKAPAKLDEVVDEIVEELDEDVLDNGLDLENEE